MPLGRPNIRGCLDTGRKTPRSGQSARACRAETRFQQASRTADPARRAANSATLGGLPGAIALALTVVLPLTAAPGPASRPGPPSPLVSITLSPARPASTDVLAAAARLLRQRAAHLHLPSTQAPGLRAGRRADRARSRSGAAQGPRHARRAELPAGAALPAVQRYGPCAQRHDVRGREPGEPAHARAVPQAGLHAG